MGMSHGCGPPKQKDEMIALIRAAVERGVTFFDMSEAASKTLRQAHDLQPVTALQSEYSLWHRLPEAEVLPTCEELGIGFVPFSPLGRGFLTGKLDISSFAENDLRKVLPRFVPEMVKANQAFIELLHRIAERKMATSAQIALAWLLAQKPWIVPIPGTTKLGRLEENIGAAHVELTIEDLREIESSLSKLTVHGNRYPEHLERQTGR